MKKPNKPIKKKKPSTKRKPVKKPQSDKIVKKISPPKTRKNPKGAGRKTIVKASAKAQDPNVEIEEVEPDEISINHINLKQIEKLAGLGMSDREIAVFMKIAERTLTYYKAKYPVIKQALERGKVVADSKVRQAFFKMATGFRYIERKTKLIPPDAFVLNPEFDALDRNDVPKYIQNPSNKNIILEVTKTSKLITPSPFAIALWGLNRWGLRRNDPRTGDTGLDNEELNALKKLAITQMIEKL
jgi:hypothetical protein